MQFHVTTDASPGQVLQALTDFTERRPRIWHRTLDPKTFELRELGDTWAVARESTAGLANRVGSPVSARIAGAPTGEGPWMEVASSVSRSSSSTAVRGASSVPPGPSMPAAVRQPA